MMNLQRDIWEVRKPSPGFFRTIIGLRYKHSTQKPPGEMYFTRVDEPWETVSIDLIGPFPRSSKGNCYAIVFQDKFTKWVQIKAIRKATSAVLIRQFQENIIYQFGSPRTVISDNGSQFTSQAFRKVLKEWGIKQRLTPPYTPQANPVERANKVVGTMIAQVTKGEAKKWDTTLAEIAFAMNTVRHNSTKFSPAFLNYGRELLPTGTLIREVKSKQEGEELQPEEHEERMGKVQEMRQLAREALSKAFEEQRKPYNLRRRPYKPKVGELVYCREHILSDKAKGISNKLTPKYDGPYEIKRIISPVIVELQGKKKRGEYLRVHVKDIRVMGQDIDDNLIHSIPIEEMVEGGALNTVQEKETKQGKISQVEMAPVRRTKKDKKNEGRSGKQRKVDVEELNQKMKRLFGSPYSPYKGKEGGGEKKTPEIVSQIDQSSQGSTPSPMVDWPTLPTPDKELREIWEAPMEWGKIPSGDEGNKMETLGIQPLPEQPANQILESRGKPRSMGKVSGSGETLGDTKVLSRRMKRKNRRNNRRTAILVAPGQRLYLKRQDAVALGLAKPV
uniref:Integrase catalytic domain-containing protein n=1 Tax=Photinus pyralis TaxID=7054 RepID=A0A1Y1JY12_PHOPY